jgi:hypothetical protein
MVTKNNFVIQRMCDLLPLLQKFPNNMQLLGDLDQHFFQNQDLANGLESWKFM